MFYSEYSGVVPDIQIMAKGIAGGLPLSAIVGKNYLFKDQKPGSMGGTYCKYQIECSIDGGRKIKCKRQYSWKRVGMRGGFGSPRNF
jgi:acetylornithine/succinyldiaminopimelate/putrescine aminotransferase